MKKTKEIMESVGEWGVIVYVSAVGESDLVQAFSVTGSGRLGDVVEKALKKAFREYEEDGYLRRLLVYNLSEEQEVIEFCNDFASISANHKICEE